jgi:predicted DNA-binding transcriptional regulator AlpA
MTNTPTATVTEGAPPPALLTSTLIRRHYLPISKPAFKRWLSAAKFPPAEIRTGKLHFWRRQTVESWIDAQAAANTN